MSHNYPPAPARSRPTQQHSTNRPTSTTAISAKTKPHEAHPLPPNPMHHQNFIKQQIKSNHHNSHYSSYSHHHQSYPYAASSSRSPHIATINTMAQPFGNHGSSLSVASGSSSIYSAHSASSSSSTQPSPATSATSSAASSLRTPPDFLMHGTSPSMAKLPDGFVATTPPKTYLSIDEIDERLKLLDSLTTDLNPILPKSPPAWVSSMSKSSRKSRTASEDETVESLHRLSPSGPKDKQPSPAAPPAPKLPPPQSSKDEPSPRKRQSRETDDADDGALPSFKKKVVRGATSAPVADRTESATSSTSKSNRSRELIEERERTQQQFNSTAAAYQAVGRVLKHQADRHYKETEEDGCTPKKGAQTLALFEATEAILCYAYAFWCEDQASEGPRPCIVGNWKSLLSLLHWAIDKNDRHGQVTFAGMCRHLEALVLQHLSSHGKRYVQEQLSKMSDPDNQSSTEPPSSSSSSMAKLSMSLNKALEDEDKSRHLLIQSRSVLSKERLSRDFPEVWSASISSTLRSSSSTARSLDPAKVESTGHPSTDPPQAQWSWPLDTFTPFPHIVCFGRALLREGSQRTSISYQLSPVG
ncbi:unnamed protein product [Sympodiomycopsis kandeliae]